jgi:hypothetical protein
VYVQYGDYQHADYEASIRFTAQALRSRWRGYRYAMRYTMEIIGELSCNHPTKTLSQQIEELIDAYGVDGKTLGLYESDGTPTRHFLDATRIDLRDGPTIEMRRWPKGDMGEYAAQRTYHIVATAEYYAPDPRDFWPGMIQYQEHMTYRGQPNLQARKYVYDQNGTEHEQVVAVRFPLMLIQSGEAKGYGGWVFPLGPIEPSRVMPELTDESYLSPTFGNAAYSGADSMEYETRWQYVMAIVQAAYGNYYPVSR